MSAQSRWLRVNIDWDDSDWIAELSVGAQLAWIKLLCHVKREGAAGRVKALSSRRASQRWGIPVAEVEELFDAAANDNAVIEENGEWVVTAWAVYQPSDRTNNERQRRYRDGKTPLCGEQEEPLSEPKEPDDSQEVTPITPLLRHATETETETYQPTVGSAPAPKGKPDKWDRAPNLNDHLPESLRSDRLRSVWIEFVGHRREKKADPYTTAGLGKLASALVNQRYTAEMVPALVERCMASNWAGIPAEEISRFAKSPLVVVEGGKVETPEEREAAAIEAAIQAGSLRRLADGRIV